MRKNEGITSDTKAQRVFDGLKSIRPARYLDLGCTLTPVSEGNTSELKEKKDFAFIKSVRNELRGRKAHCRKSSKMTPANIGLLQLILDVAEFGKWTPLAAHFLAMIPAA